MPRIGVMGLRAVAGFLRDRRRRRAQVAKDAQDFIDAYGASAYEEARTLAHDNRRGTLIDHDRPERHWDRVRREIARRTKRQWVDTATRWLEG